MKRAVLILLMLAATMIAAVEWARAQAVAPTFKVENPRIDVGEIKAGTEAVATFVFLNEGTEDVKILKAKPS